MTVMQPYPEAESRRNELAELAKDINKDKLNMNIQHHRANRELYVSWVSLKRN
jgi:hypothetical protein